MRILRKRGAVVAVVLEVLMMGIVLCFLVIHAREESSSDSKSRGDAQNIYGYVQCQLCKTPELVGDIKDCGCKYETVDKALSTFFHPILRKIITQPFFRYFKIDLGKECPFWDDAGTCSSRECAVCECESHEIQKKWHVKEFMKSKVVPSEKKDTSVKHVSEACDEQEGKGDLSRVVRSNAEVGESFTGWDTVLSDSVWIDEHESANMAYINLLENPERYTGYSGPPAERIWRAIYKENCFQPQQPSGVSTAPFVFSDMCFEERVYYRLVSGLQASINTHIALEYKYGDSDWGVNTELYVERVGQHPEYLENLYFLYLFVMRAVGKAHKLLKDYDYDTGNPVEDEETRDLIAQLTKVDDSEGASCPSEKNVVLQGFDENQLFRVDTTGMDPAAAAKAKKEKEELAIQFRSKFQNVSRIMDCVACEKCRLWGTIQIMGIGTAIKILLADDVEKIPPLQRNEVVALINVLKKLSSSVDGVTMFRELEFRDALRKLATLVLAPTCIVLLMVLRTRCMAKSNGYKNKKT